MKALTIKDLSHAVELDASSMSAVHGGMFKGGSLTLPSFGPSFSYTSSDLSFGASQQLMQEQNTLVNNGNNVAFAHGITSTVTPTQTGSNNINFR
jgi:hypothetical protein